MSNGSLLSRITVDPEICHGKPCIRGLRYPVETILEYLAGGDTIEDLLKEFPDLEREDILACHEFARRMLTAKTIHLPLHEVFRGRALAAKPLRGTGATRPRCKTHAGSSCEKCHKGHCP